MTHVKPVNRRNNLILIVVACLALAAVAVGGVVALTSGSDGRPDSTGGGGSAETTESTQKYFFMIKGDGTLAKLQMVVGPAGQMTGTHVLVRFSDDTGDARPEEPEEFGGTVIDGRYFRLTGLSDNRPFYEGNLQGGFLTLDGTFGVSETKWKQIPSAAAFDKAVSEHAKSLEGCEQEGYMGCAE